MIGRFPLNINGIEYAVNSFTNYPYGIVNDTVHNRIVVSIPVIGKVYILDATTLDFVSELSGFLNPTFIKFDATNDRYFVVREDPSITDTVDIINATTLAVTFNAIPPATPSLDVIRGFEFDYANNKMFVSNFWNNAINVYKISDLSFITSFAVTKACGLNLDTANNRLYVTQQSNKTIAIYNPTTYALISTINLATVCGETYDIIQDTVNANILLVTDRVQNKIFLVDKTTNLYAGAISIGSSPATIAMKADGDILCCFYGINKVGVIKRFYS